LLKLAIFSPRVRGAGFKLLILRIRIECATTVAPGALPTQIGNWYFYVKGTKISINGSILNLRIYSVTMPCNE